MALTGFRRFTSGELPVGVLWLALFDGGGYIALLLLNGPRGDSGLLKLST